MKTNSYTRSTIPPHLVIPWGELKLVYTSHALSRMDARTKGSLSILPTMITLSKKTLKQVWAVEGEESEGLRSMLVEIPYTRGTLLQLVISADGIVITLYFRDTKWQRTNAKRVEALQLESIASGTSPEVLSEDPVLDARGQVVYPKGTYFPRAS